MEQEIIEEILLKGSELYGKTKNKKVQGKIEGSKNLIAFAQYMDKSFQSPNHIQLIAKHLQDVTTGKIRYLIINMPPRHGKSQLCTRLFPTWYLGNKPEAQIIVSSYSANLAVSFTRFQRNLCNTQEYREVFPKLKIKQDNKSKNEWETTYGGVVIGAGVDGPITGRGADLALIDDPFKNYEEAKSEVNRETVWNWYQSTLLTRLHPGGAIILIQTRWVTDDLAGKLIEKDGTKENGGKWTVLKLPAISEKGEALWKERYTIEDLKEVRKSQGEKIFQAMYQQEPVDIQEKLFTDPQIEETPEKLKLIAYLDPAFGGNDYCAFTIGTSHTENNKTKIYIKHGSIWKAQIDETYDNVEKLCKQYNVQTLYIESNQAQTVLSYELNKRGIYTKQVKNIQNKHLRIVNAIKLNWERIYFSNTVNADYLKQIINYSELSIHDDAPDSLAGLIERLNASSGDINKRYSFVKWLRGL